MAAQSVKRLYASAEWTSEGDLKAFSEYGRRRGTSVIKVQHMLVCAEWMILSSSRVAPQVFVYILSRQ